MRGSWWVRVVALGVTLAMAFTPLHAAAKLPLPPELQVTLLNKILSFDRSLHGRTGPLQIMVIYQADYPESAAAKDRFMRAVREAAQTSDGQLRFKVVAIKGKPDFADVFASMEASGAFIMPLRGIGVSGLAKAASDAGVRTFSGIADYVYEGVSVTMGEATGRPAIYINLKASRAQGSDFSSQLLKLATVVD